MDVYKTDMTDEAQADIWQPPKNVEVPAPGDFQGHWPFCLEVWGTTNFWASLGIPKRRWFMMVYDGLLVIR